jgi:hypothetical protein
LKFDGTKTTLPSVPYNAAFAPTAALTYEAWIKPGIAAADRTTSEFLVQLGDGGWGVFLVAGGLSLVGRCRLTQ